MDNRTKGGLVGLVGTVAAGLLITIVPSFEGTQYKAYRDVGGIVTICNGDTHNVHVGETDTPAQCQARLEKQLEIAAKGVLACTPILGRTGNEYKLAAAASLGYNIGAVNYCGSSVAKAFRKGLMTEGCNNFLKWDHVNGKVISGLKKRREAERIICLKQV